MQTFLPYDDYKFSAQCLDNQRVGKQRVEAWQILNALGRKTGGWINHPATVMWRGHEQALIHYGMVMCGEWEERGFEDNMFVRFQARFDGRFDYQQPWWIGYEAFHISHRSNLYRKDPIHYAEFAQYGADLPYVWCEPDGYFHLGTDKERHLSVV